MAKPAKHDIEIYKGDDFELFFKVREPFGGPYVNLTGWTGRAQLRATKASSQTAAVFTVTVLDQTASLGGVTVTLTDTETAAISIEAGVYDVELTAAGAGGKVRTYLEGAVTVLPDVTRT